MKSKLKDIVIGGLIVILAFYMGVIKMLYSIFEAFIDCGSEPRRCTCHYNDKEES